MAQQNMWKKQMMANKNKANQTKPEPSNTSANNTTPPWVKNNQNNTPAVNSFIKNNSSSDNSNTNQPPWAKNNSTDTTNNNPPPWAKNNTNTVNQPPSPKVEVPKIDSPKPNAVNVPPWMKPKQQASSNAPSNPPWAKQNQDSGSTTLNKVNSNPPQNAPSNNPPWMKANNAAETAPAWANKNNNSPQPAWANKAGSAQTAVNPPWMKKEENSPVQNSNLLKAQKIADMQKQKKELEEKQRQLQQEEKERKREEKLRKQKQQQQKNIQRELKIMQIEDDLSAKREKFDRDELERIEKEKKQRQQKERIERQLRQTERARLQKEKVEAEEKEKQRLRLEKEERTRLQNERIDLEKLQKSKSRSGRKSKRALQSSKISHISSIKAAQNLQSSSINAFQNIQIAHTERDPSLPENLFHKYTRLMNEECSQADYRNKIAIQKLIIQTQLQFKRECENEISELIEKKKVTNRKRKIVFSNNMQIRYGLCQGKKGDSGLEFINDQSQKLKNIFLYYQAITKCITSLLKKKINIHFRVPLLSLAQYKGITFLLQYVCQELVEINQTDISLFQQISNEVLILEKQLQLCYDGRNDFLKPLNRSQLMVKKVNIYREDYYVLYIKEETIQPKPKKNETTLVKIPHKILPQIPNITYLKLIEYISDQSNMLPFYNPPLLPPTLHYDFYEKTASPASKILIKQLTLANSINTVYSSCQGEVQENIFFSLILNENKDIWQMIRSAGSPLKEVPSPIALSYLQKITSLRFNFTSNFYSKKAKQLTEVVKPHVYIQKHQFEMLQFIKNLQKYIGEEKEDLIEQSMRMNRQLWEEITKSNTGNCENGVNLMQLKKEVNYLLFKKQQSEALELLQNSQKKLSVFAIQNISIALLFIKIYIKTDAEIKLLKKLSQLLQILQFYFKEETIIHSYVYTIVGSYYSKKTADLERQSKVITFYEHAISIAFKLYGEKAQQVAEIYLSRANSMLHLKKTEAFQKDMSFALKIYKMHSKNNLKIAQCNYLLGKVACMEGRKAEGVELMDNSSNLFLKMQNYVESLNVSFEVLSFIEGDQAKYEAQIERIVEVCFRYKSIWAFQKIVSLLLDRQLHCYTSLNIDTLKDLYAGEEEDRSSEQIILDLQEQIKGFTCFIEIIRWSLSILAAKALIRKQSTSDYWKALEIMKDVLHFYGKSRPSQSISPIKESQILSS